jgi:hypothetical protein
MLKTVMYVILVMYLRAPLSLISEENGIPTNSSVQNEITARGVVDKYLRIIGGVDALKAIKNKRIQYRVHMFGRKAYLMERSWTRPNMMKTGVPGGPAYTLTEGEKSWRVSPEGKRELPPAAAATIGKMADIDGPFVDSSKKGITLTYVDIIHYDMSELHEITVTFSDNTQWSCFFDAATGLLRMMKQPSFKMLNGKISPAGEITTFYYGFHPVGNVQVPHFWIQSAEDHTHLFVIEQIKLNE